MKTAWQLAHLFLQTWYSHSSYAKTYRAFWDTHWIAPERDIIGYCITVPSSTEKNPQTLGEKKSTTEKLLNLYRQSKLWQRYFRCCIQVMVQEAKFNMVSLPKLQLAVATFCLCIPGKMTLISKPGCKRVLVRNNHYILEKQNQDQNLGFLPCDLCLQETKWFFCTDSPQIPWWIFITLWIQHFNKGLFCPAVLHEGHIGSFEQTSEYICIPAQFIVKNVLCVDQHFWISILKLGF